MSGRLLLALALLWGCGTRLPPAPELTAVSPQALRQGAAAPLLLSGRNFNPRVQVDLDAPERSQPQGDFTASLVTGTEELPLVDLRLETRERISAQAPATVPAGRYDVLLRDGWGRTTRLPGALLVGADCVDAAGCDDGLVCTTDACVEGVCAQTPAPDACVIDGVCRRAFEVEPAGGCRRCDPSAAINAWSDVPDGTACDDGDLCTIGERCTAQQCGSPAETVSCPAPEACHAQGVCEPATGLCTTPPLLDGTPCDDGDLCTQGESCLAGACAGSAAQVTCPPLSCQGEGVCNPATGACERPHLSGACDDQSPCTTGDACVAGECRGQSAVCADTVPRACLQLSAVAIALPGEVTLDPSCTSDLETPTAALEARFDLDGDGAFDTPFAPLAPQTTPVLTEGVHALTVEVRDPAGNVASAVRHLAAFDRATAVVVTTPLEEEDPGATVAAPGGTGLSLDEAVHLVNASPTLRTIHFAEPMTVRSTGLPPLTAAGVRLVGGPGIRVEFTPAGTLPCVRLGSNQLLLGLELSGCGGDQVELGGSGTTVLDSTLSGGADDGVVITGADNAVGPGVDLTGFGNRGLLVRADGATLRGVRSWANAAAGIQLGPQGRGARVIGCRSWSNLGAGIAIGAQVRDARLWQNTLDGNGADGVDANNQAMGIDLRGNLISGNARFGVCGLPASFSQLQPNGFWQNGLGEVCSGAVQSPSVVGDPAYVMSDGDFRPSPGSVAIDASVDLGVDLNGASAGNWSGSLPDLGAVDSGR